MRKAKFAGVWSIFCAVLCVLAAVSIAGYFLYFMAKEDNIIGNWAVFLVLVLFWIPTLALLLPTAALSGVTGVNHLSEKKDVTDRAGMRVLIIISFILKGLSVACGLAWAWFFYSLLGDFLGEPHILELWRSPVERGLMNMIIFLIVFALALLISVIADLREFFSRKSSK